MISLRSSGAFGHAYLDPTMLASELLSLALSLDELVTYIKVVRLIPSDRSGALYIIRYIILAILLL